MLLKTNDGTEFVLYDIKYCVVGAGSDDTIYSTHTVFNFNTVNNLTPATDYYFIVQAIDISDNKSEWGAVFGTTLSR